MKQKTLGQQFMENYREIKRLEKEKERKDFAQHLKPGMSKIDHVLLFIKNCWDNPMAFLKMIIFAGLSLWFFAIAICIVIALAKTMFSY